MTEAIPLKCKTPCQKPGVFTEVFPYPPETSAFIYSFIIVLERFISSEDELW